MAPIGEGGWWIGVAAAVLYFTLLDSSISHGKTLGKKLLGIEVRSVGGGYINPFDSLLRVSLFAIIFAVYKFWMLEDQRSAIITLLALTADLVAIAIVVFGLTHPHRRSLHDLLLDSVVVHSKAPYALPRASLRTPLLALLGAGIVLCGAHLAMYWMTIHSPDTAPEQAVLYMLRASPIHLDHVRVRIATHSKTGSSPTRAIFISAYLRKPMSGDIKKDTQILATRIRLALMESRLVPKDVLLAYIEIRNGIDIGIARTMNSAEVRLPLTGAVQPGSDSLKGVLMPTLGDTSGGPQIRYRSTKGFSRRAAEAAAAAKAAAAKAGGKSVAPPAAGKPARPAAKPK